MRATLPTISIGHHKGFSAIPVRPVVTPAAAAAQGIRIRAGRRSDGARIAEFGHAAWLKGIGVHVSANVRARLGQGVFSDFARRFWRQILVAEVDGAVVGFAATEFGDNYVSDLWVAPSVEGTGIGSWLLTATEARVAARGYRTAEIEVLTANRRALELYRRRGYAIVRQYSGRDSHLRVVLHSTRLRKALRGTPPLTSRRGRS